MASRGGDDGDDTQGVNEQGGVEYEDDGFGSANEPEPEGEELFDENVNRDYEAMPHLDTYEQEGMVRDDDVQFDAVREAEARQRAEAALDERDVHEGRAAAGRRRPRALDEDEDEGQTRQRRRMGDDAFDGMFDDDEEEDFEERVEDIEDVKGKLSEWLKHSNVRREVSRRFKRFLRTFDPAPREAGQRGGRSAKAYSTAIQHMVIYNQQSLDVDFQHLTNDDKTMQIAIWIADCPREMLDILNLALREEVLRRFPHNDEIKEELFVRVHNLPVTDSLRELRQSHLNVFVQVSGVVTRRGGVYPQLGIVKYDCQKCGYVLGPFTQSQEEELRVSNCPQCQSGGPFTVNQEETTYRNYQKLTLQESPSAVPAGRLPRQKDVVLLNDLIDTARPGDEVVVTGIFTNNFSDSLNTKHGFPVFSTLIEAVHIKKQTDLIGATASKLSEEDKRDIKEMSKDPRIASKIVNSVAPSIHGYHDVKLALALALFGGREKHVDGKTRLRGDVNVLLLGDPGTAKSQFLKFLEKTAPRAVYTTGKGASAVGLTASVHKDPVTREWTLEGGALVLADKGMCLIDEFDKMNDQDRVSIHEAMEQQSISISKAGIVTSLQARCSVIAAANPVGGRYDSQRTFAENVQLTDPILSRFDVLGVVRDVVDADQDSHLAKFVVNSHVKAHPDVPKDSSDLSTTSGVIDHDKLRKYITYAREHVKPQLRSEADLDKIYRVYAELRRESVTREGMPVAVRHIESVVRMAEAHAAMHLREHVTDGDVSVAIKVMLTSFINTQKIGIQRTLQRKFSHYLNFQSDYHHLLLDILRELVREKQRYETALGAVDDEEHIRVRRKRLSDRAHEFGIADIGSFLNSDIFQEHGFSIDFASGDILQPRG